MNMNTIDFTKLEMRTSLGGDTYTIRDGRLAIADLIFQQVPGLTAHVLAEKIYNSSGPVSLSDQERELILQISPGLFPLQLCRAIEKQLNEQ